MKVLLVVFLSFIVLVGGVGFYWMSVLRREGQLRNQISAQQDVNQASHDTMWRILEEKAGVTSQYKDAFNEIFPKMIEARYKDRNNLLFQFVKESNPNFDTSLYKDLMASIESERKTFLREQKKLRDLKMEHDNIIDLPPSSFFVGSKPKINVVIVTSTETQEVFEKGVDNRKLFK